MCRGADLHLLKQLSIATHTRLMFYLCRDPGSGEIGNATIWILADYAFSGVPRGTPEIIYRAHCQAYR